MNKEDAELKKTTAQLLIQSNSVEWYTPKKYIDAVRDVLGEIDLDPASCAQANDIVGAQIYYSVEENGLTKNWHGRVFLNPPYGGVCSAFVKKLCASYEGGQIESAILLVNSNATDTAWFSPLWDHVLCFTDHRINFWSVSKDTKRSTHGNCFVYFGEAQAEFVGVFSKFGPVVKRFRHDHHGLGGKI